MMAYYLLVNYGWEPSKYANLPYRERTLLALFAEKEIHSRES